MILLRLLGLGAVYGLGFALVKSLFPSPVILLTLVTGPSSEGNLTVLALVYIGIGLLAGLIAAPIFGGLLLLRRPDPDRRGSPRLALSLALSVVMGVVAGALTLLVYAVEILPPGGVLDPVRLIEASNFPTGVPLLVAWAIARDILPAGLAGLFLAPLAGRTLVTLYRGEAGRVAPVQRTYEADM